MGACRIYTSRCQHERDRTPLLVKAPCIDELDSKPQLTIDDVQRQVKGYEHREANKATLDAEATTGMISSTAQDILPRRLAGHLDVQRLCVANPTLDGVVMVG